MILVITNILKSKVSKTKCPNGIIRVKILFVLGNNLSANYKINPWKTKVQLTSFLKLIPKMVFINYCIFDLIPNLYKPLKIFFQCLAKKTAVSSL
ncbi:hypothetical protein DHD05_14655 [Arenibacter sp. N53]|nr:hypothetical protein [Arenibacter sp. N53]